MKKQWNKLAILAIATMFTFSSCNLNKEVEPRLDAENTQSLEDNSFSESEFDAVTDIEQATSEDRFGRPAGDKDGMENLLPQCATVSVMDTVIGNTIHKKITVDFGTTGCTYQGRTYKGKIISVHSKKYSVPTARIVTKFQNFYVKKAGEPDTKYVQLLATKVVVNESQASPNNPNIAVGSIKHRVRVFAGDALEYNANSYAKLLFPNGKTIEWNTERLRTWAEGASTPFILADDIFLVAGTHKGKNINNVTFQVQTIEGSPLQFKFVCWALGIFRPTKGKLQISSSNTPTFVVDFGDGSCDNNFTVQQ
jgi:hypothetical protein